MPELRTHGLVYGVALMAVAPLPQDLKTRDIHKLGSAQLQQLAVHDHWASIGMSIYGTLLLLSLAMAFVLIKRYDLIWPAFLPGLGIQAPWIARWWLRRQRISL